MSIAGKAAAIGLATSFLYGLAVPNAWAQHTSAPATTNQSADYEEVLDQADEEDKETYIESYVSLRYRHDQFLEGLNGDELRIHWQQSFGPSGRLAAGIELPFIDVRGDGSNTAGIGDIHLDFRGMISKGERFEQAAGIEVIAPSASHELLDDGQTVLSLLWGFSVKISKRTTLDGEARYRKAVSSRFGTPELNNLGGEFILTQAFTQRFGVFLDSENYYEFSFQPLDLELYSEFSIQPAPQRAIHGYVNTLKIGAEVMLDRQKKWSLSPYVLLPFTQAARHLETDGAAGLDLTFKY
jgi:hypothetical protein